MKDNNFLCDAFLEKSIKTHGAFRSNVFPIGLPARVLIMDYLSHYFVEKKKK